MAVDKRIPRVLNSDADSKTINKVSMRDALNLYSGPDTDGFVNGSKVDSGSGVLKNIKGTEMVSIQEGEDLPGDARVLGSVEDVKTNITYFFVYSTQAAKQGVWAYDKTDALNAFDGGTSSGTPYVRLIYKSNQFNFPQNGFVKADIIYSNASQTLSSLGDNFDKDVIIYFTDGSNEPRKINAYRAFVESSGSDIHGDDAYAEADFITACPKTPIKPIIFSFQQDPERSVNNFSRTQGFQFAYQHIYIDGFESAISSYSDLAFPNSVLDQGAQTNIDDTLSNKCVLQIPECGPEIIKVRILGRQGNAGSFLVIDEIDASSETQTYDFYNDRVLKGVSQAEVNKQFDSVPRQAKAQTTSSNRLMYGNYVDGFDSPNVSAYCTVNYKERPADFIQYSVGYIPSVYGGFATTAASDSRDNASFFLTFNDLPDEFPADTVIDFSLSLAPSRNWHYFYGQGYQTLQRGPQPIGGNLGIHDGVNYQQSYSLYGSENVGTPEFPRGSGIPEQHLTNDDITFPSVGGGTVNVFDGKIWGGPIDNPTGLQINSDVQWKRAYIDMGSPSQVASLVPDTQEARFGTGPANPFIFEGKPINFSAQIRINQDISDARTKVCLAISEAIANPNVPDGYQFINECEGITLISKESKPSYSFDLGLQSGDLIDQHFIGNGEEPKTHSDKICAVWGADSSGVTGVPTGYFIVNKATPEFRLKRLTHEVEFNPAASNWGHMDSAFNEYLNSIGVENPSHAYHFALALVGFSDVELHTCIHDTQPSGTNVNLVAKPQWIVISAEDIDEIEETQNFAGWLDAQEGYGSNTFANSGFGNVPPGVPPANRNQGYGSQIGRLVFSPFNTTNDEVIKLTLIQSYSDAFSNFPNPWSWIVAEEYGDDFWGGPETIFMIKDGLAGPGGGPAQGYVSDGSQHPYDRLKMYAQGSVTVNRYGYPTGASFVTQWRNTVFYGGSLTPTPNSPLDNIDPGKLPTILPFLINKSTVESAGENVTITPDFEYQIPQGVQGGLIFNDYDNETGLPSVDFKRNQSVITPFSFNFTISGATEQYGNSSESFKTKANHDFGIVYYDERGRHGFVTYLDSVYVKGYGERDSSEGYGPTSINVHLEHDPPPWAHNYKIVYGGNSSVNDFVQYTVGGAFVGGDPDDQLVAESNKNIYVSLNYLQGHPVSYVSAFGARNKEGGLNLYKFQEGDKLAVISYGPGDSRTYEDYEFDVVGVVDLGVADNPLTAQENPKENQKGQFVILKDNVDAAGFNHASVAFTGQSNWEKNCIVELRTPRKQIDPDDQFYYEASDSYRVLKNQDESLSHEVPVVTLTKGDVWFRRVATNVKPLLNNDYIDIIPDDDGADPSPQPNFTNVYLETESASDLFKSDSLSYKGRPNAVFENEKETRREATITYSQPSNPEGKKINYSSFNASEAPFKDLSERYGDIQYIGSHNDFIVVIQKEKISMVPVDKNVLSDASGNQQIIASLNILGEVITYAGVSGCDDDPSSVYDSGDEVYFCNKALSKVYRWTKNGGVEEISNTGMSSIIRAQLNRAIRAGQVRIVGGFDPLKEEYLLSILNPSELEATGVVVLDQPAADTVTPGGDGETGGGDDGGEEGDGEEEAAAPLSASIDSWDFGQVDVGETEALSFTLSLNDGYDGTAFVIEDIVFGGENASYFSVITPSLPLSINDLSFPLNVEVQIAPTESAIIQSEMQIQYSIIGDFLTTIPQDPILIDLTATSSESASSPVLLELTDDYNDFYLSNISTDEMSAELAVQYLMDLKNAPLDQQPTGSQIGTLFRSANRESMKRISLATLGSNSSVVNEVYDPSKSIFSDNVIQPDLPPPPPPSSLPLFTSTQEAVDYLIAAGHMTVWNFYQYFGPSSISDMRHVYNVNNQGSITITDFLEILTAFGSTFTGSDTAFNNNLPAALIENPEFTPEQVLGFIQQQHLSGEDPMTVAQFYQLGQYLRSDMRVNADFPSEVLAQGIQTTEDGLNATFSVTTSDLLIMLSVLPQGVTGGTNDWEYSLTDPILGL